MHFWVLALELVTLDGLHLYFEALFQNVDVMRELLWIVAHSIAEQFGRASKKLVSSYKYGAQFAAIGVVNGKMLDANTTSESTAVSVIARHVDFGSLGAQSVHGKSSVSVRIECTRMARASQTAVVVALEGPSAGLQVDLDDARNVERLPVGFANARGRGFVQEGANGQMLCLPQVSSVECNWSRRGCRQGGRTHDLKPHAALQEVDDGQAQKVGDFVGAHV